MFSDELSNALFCFSLRCLGAEFAGGFSTPPPSMSWKIQTASRARVKGYRRKTGPREAETDSRYNQKGNQGNSYMASLLLGRNISC